MEVGDFISRFHSIPGKTLPEIQKNFNSLLKTIPLDHDALIASIVPKNRQEHLFKLKLLLKLQRSPELIKILKNKEEYFPAKLLKNRWFCQKLAAVLDEDSSGFVDNILSYTSYVIRKRIITKVATHGTKLDKVYDEVCTHYGTYTGQNLLTGCSEEKIEQVLRSSDVVLPGHLQIILFKRYPHLFALYIKQAKSVDNYVMSQVARHDINTFVQMIGEFNNPNADLGKRLTTKLLTDYKNLLIEKSSFFSCILHLKTVIKFLKEEDLKEFFFNCSPNFDSLNYGGLGFNSLREKLGRLYYTFLSELMEKKYKKNLQDFPDLVTERMMETMDVEEREKWTSIKKKKTPEIELIPFMRLSDSIPLIKSKINVTSSINMREKLLVSLVKSCKVNNNLNALVEVCEYVSTRHRNDDSSILWSCLHQIQSLFSWNKLEARHWDAINSIVKLSKNRDQSYYNFDFLYEYVKFSFRQNKLTDRQIKEYLHLVKRMHHWGKCVNIENQALRQLLLLKTIDFMPELLEKGEKLEYEDLKIIHFILQWNKDYPKDEISFSSHPRLVRSLRKSIQAAIQIDSFIPEISVLSIIFEKIVCTKEKSQLRDEIIENYFIVDYRYYNIKIDVWLLKNEPDLITTNLAKYLEHVFFGYRPDLGLLNYIKIYTDASFRDKVINYCLSCVQECKNIETVFHALAVLVPAKKFLQYIAPFYPIEDKIEEDEESARRGRTAMAIAQSFKFATSTKVLPVLISYCKGDYKGQSLESLYYLFYHLPENQLNDFITELSRKSVSVRKHSIHLTCIVGNVEQLRILLKYFIENEKNISVNKHLFTGIMKYFIKNPSEEFSEYIQTCMTKLDKHDDESLFMLVDLRRVPQKYQARHAIAAWKILKKNEDSDKNKTSLLSSIPSSIFEDFPLDFLLEVIAGHFLKGESSSENAINSFVISSLSQSSHKERIMDAVFEIINRVKNTKCETLEEEKAAREMLSCFVSSLVQSFGTSEENLHTLRIFSQKWHSLFSATEAMREHLKLTFTLLHLESGKDLNKFTAAVVEFLDNLVSIYGMVIVDVFASELKDCFRTFLSFYDVFPEEFFKFLLNLIGNWDNSVFYLLTIKLLPLKQPCDHKTNELFREIIGILRQVPQEPIQMLMNLYVTDAE